MFPKKIIPILFAALTCSAFASPQVFVSRIQKDTPQESAPLGKIYYSLYLKNSDGTWTPEGHRESVDVGDCSTCYRGINILYNQFNGDANNLQSLGSTVLSVQFLGSKAQEIEYDVSSAGTLTRNEVDATVGLSIASLKLVPSQNNPQEIVFTVEDTNPFGTEVVAPGITTAPTTHKLILEPLRP